MKLWCILETSQLRKLETLSILVPLRKFLHSKSNPIFISNQSSSQVHGRASSKVGIFWDLDNKPPKSFPPYVAATRIKAAASSFGVVRSMVAYANSHAFSYVPPVVREQRKERKVMNQLETKGVIKRVEPYICRVCGRRFYANDRLINHFKQIHEREQQKRLNQIESARGSRRVKLVGKFSMKMEKYKSAVKDVLTPKVGYGLADELKRAGFWVQTVSDRPEAADDALRTHMVDMMDRRLIECVVLVSDDSDFVDVLKEARLRCLKTVVVGDATDGALKRIADSDFSWKDIMLGKAKTQAVKTVNRWKDRDILKKLEWTYDTELEGGKCMDDDSDAGEENDDTEEIIEGEKDDFQLGDTGPWWELDSNVESKSA